MLQICTFTVSHREPKRIAIDKQPDDDVMHLGRAGRADRLAHQAFVSGAQRQVLPLNVLRVALAWLVRIRLEMTRVRAPIVCIIPRDAKRFQQGFAFQKHLIFAAPKDVRQDVTTAVINRVSEPPRLTFLAHVGPHLVDFRFLSLLDHHVHVVRMQPVEEQLVHCGECRLFFFKVLITVVVLIFSTRAVSRIPLPLRLISTIWSLIAGARPL